MLRIQERRANAATSRRTPKDRLAAAVQGVTPLLAWLLTIPALAADTVVYRTGNDQSSRASVTGTIDDYVGGRLTIRSGAGAQQMIPAERIVEIQSDWTPAETLGDQRSREGNLAEAVKNYQQALRDEKRVWVQRQIVAKLVGSYGQLEQFDLAGEAFLRLLRSDPQTPHFGVIPLSWMTFSPTPALHQRAAAWMANSQDSVSALLGASWLLSTAQRAAAMQSLQRLLTDRDPRVAMLAQTQLWRTRSAMATSEEIQGWEAWLTRLPGDLRAGPCCVIGQAWSTRGLRDKSALAYLRVPILYGNDRRLAAAALLSAGGELEKIGQVQEAVTLYGEVVRDYVAAPAAAEARNRLEEFGRAAKQ
jgi:tetratricopeptide (TPR) repeat protein